jgi:Leucine-rich repeat (LRR) protein
MFSVKKLLAVILSISASLALCGCENTAVSVSETLAEMVSVTERTTTGILIEENMTTAAETTTESLDGIKITNEFPDLAFRKAIRQKLEIIDKDPIMSADVEQITELDLYGRSIYNIIGINYLKNLKTLNCYNNRLTELPELPDSLTVLDVGGNELTALPDLPDGLIELKCDGNYITELPELPESLEALNVAAGVFTEIPELPPNLKYLSIALNHDLTSICELPDSLTTLYMRSCYKLKSIPALPKNLEVLDIVACGAEMPVLPNSVRTLYSYASPETIKFEDGTTAAQRIKNGTLEFYSE